MYLNALKYRREKYSSLNAGSFKAILSFTANGLKNVFAPFADRYIFTSLFKLIQLTIKLCMVVCINYSFTHSLIALASKIYVALATYKKTCMLNNEEASMACEKLRQLA